MEGRLCFVLLMILPFSVGVPVNIAENKPTEQSSTKSDANPSSKAVDGRSSRCYDCSCTEEEKDPWWRVDLLAVYSVSSVTVTLATDSCCGANLDSFVVKVTNISSPSAPYQLCNIHTGRVGSSVTIKCSPHPVFGRYLYIQIPSDSQVLTLCEVQVYGVVISAGMILPNKECKIDTLGKNYTGLVRTTKTNVQCQRWDSQSPQTHGLTEDHQYPDDTVESAADYCRNPDNSGEGPWCYHIGHKRWTYCNVHRCPILSVNLALNKPTNQSSTRIDNGAEGGAASRAVDGNKDTYFSDGSCTHTGGDEQKPWWKVDLGTVYAVYKVKVTNRRDSKFYDRLSNFDIRVSRYTSMTSSDPLCRHYPWTVGSGATVEITCDKAVYGRYLYIQLSGSEPLTLCEVEVYELSVSGYIGGPTDVNEMKTRGSKLSIFTELRVELDGFLIGWKFNAARAGTVWADIWRQKGNKFMLVQKTQIIVTYSGEQEMRLTNGVQVKQGDVIGYHYASDIPSTQTVIRVKDSTDTCCSHVSPGTMYNKASFDGSLTIGQTNSVDKSGVLRVPAMQALVDSRNHWWQSSTLAQSGNKMTITFQAWPSDNTHLRTATKFTVQYRLETSTSTSWSQVGEDITPGSLSTGVVREQDIRPTEGIYQFKGQVVYADGTVEWTSVKRSCTAPSPVRNLVLGTSARQDSSTKATVTLTWDEPISIGCDSIRKYDIAFKKNTDSTWSESQTTQSTSYTLRDLDAYTVYTFGVTAINDGSLGSSWKNITRETTETVPSPVTSLGVTPSLTSLLISWGVPAQPNGVITGYRVGYSLINRMACSTTPQPTDYVYKTITTATTTQYILDRLEEYTQYDITVEAGTSVGYGQSSKKKKVPTATLR